MGKVIGPESSLPPVHFDIKKESTLHLHKITGILVIYALVDILLKNLINPFTI